MSCPKCGFISDYSKVDGSFLEYNKGKDCPICGHNESIGKIIDSTDNKKDSAFDNLTVTDEDKYPYKKKKKKF